MRFRYSTATETRLTYAGHSTLLIELDGLRILTDPVLGQRVLHINRVAPLPDPRVAERIDYVLVSHAHLDHLDIPSLRRLGPLTQFIVPAGTAHLLRRAGLPRVVEASPGDELELGGVTLTATPAVHSGFRPPFGPAAVAVGYVISGSRRIYFAGDTDLFPGMADLAPGLDLALVPVWGWGPRLGPGHLTPERAGVALQLLRPAVVVPIHWGTFWMMGLGPFLRDRITAPPRLFAAAAEALAPEVQVRVLEPGGESVVL
jgi:L-ascorbate metabolism protein UlaG (beta-lactamase superfamily)